VPRDVEEGVKTRMRFRERSDPRMRSTEIARKGLRERYTHFRKSGAKGKTTDASFASVDSRYVRSGARGGGGVVMSRRIKRHVRKRFFHSRDREKTSGPPALLLLPITGSTQNSLTNSY